MRTSLTALILCVATVVFANMDWHYNNFVNECWFEFVDKASQMGVYQIGEREQRLIRNRGNDLIQAYKFGDKSQKDFARKSAAWFCGDATAKFTRYLHIASR